MKIIYVTDLHGNKAVYEKFLALLAKSRDIKAAIIGGDISPGYDIETQRDFLENWLLPRLREFRKSCNKPIFIMMGNDDYFINMDLLYKAKNDGLLNILHDDVHKIGDYYLVGYPFVNPTPSIIKDWEKQEIEIEKDLEGISKKTDPKRTVYVFHAPPFDTALDVLYSGMHVGSIAIKRFIQSKKPMLTLHGHIHESPDMSGKIFERFGKTLSANPGACRILCLNLKRL